MRERLGRLAWLLDSSIPIPGTRLSIGLEALIGLFPVIGDLLGVLASSYILAEAARMGVGKAVLARMAFNVAVEGLIGIVPLVGDLFDAGWKANQKNVRLLDAWMDARLSPPALVDRPMTWLRRVAVASAVLAALALVLSGPGTRFGLWPWNVGIALFGLAGLLGIVAAIAAAIGRRLLVLALGVAAAALPIAGLVQGLSAPRINDVSSELALTATPDSAFSKALSAAGAMGWEIVKSDSKAGQIQAVATSFWFGFKDDVLVRVAAAGPGSRIDVRSKSRVGRSDLGTNARRIRAYFERLK